MKKYGFKYVLHIKGNSVDSALARYYSSLNGVIRALNYWKALGFECRAYDNYTMECVGR